MNFFRQNSSGDTAELTKQALVFVEGNHKDSKGRKHNFSAERLRKIVDVTNRRFEAGERIPLQTDHKKTQEFNLGDVESKFRTEIITENNLPNPKHRHLLGKLGVFVDKIVVKGSKAVEKVLDKTISTVSAGIDPITESFIEVSATPFPAIVGPTLFSSNDNEEDSILLLEFAENDNNSDSDSDKESKPLRTKVGTKTKVFSMEEALGLGKQKEDLKKRYEMLSEALYYVLETYYMSSEEDLEGKNPVASSFKAISFFVSELEKIFNLTESDNPLEILGNLGNLNKKGTVKTSFNKEDSKTIKFRRKKNGSQSTRKRVRFIK